MLQTAFSQHDAIFNPELKTVKVLSNCSSCAVQYPNYLCKIPLKSQNVAWCYDPDHVLFAKFANGEEAIISDELGFDISFALKPNELCYSDLTTFVWYICEKSACINGISTLGENATLSNIKCSNGTSLKAIPTPLVLYTRNAWIIFCSIFVPFIWIFCIVTSITMFVRRNYFPLRAKNLVAINVQYCSLSIFVTSIFLQAFIPCGLFYFCITVFPPLVFGSASMRVRV